MLTARYAPLSELPISPGVFTVDVLCVGGTLSCYLYGTNRVEILGMFLSEGLNRGFLSWIAFELFEAERSVFG